MVVGGVGLCCVVVGACDNCCVRSSPYMIQDFVLIIFLSIFEKKPNLLVVKIYEYQTVLTYPILCT